MVDVYTHTSGSCRERAGDDVIGDLGVANGQVNHEVLATLSLLGNVIFHHR